MKFVDYIYEKAKDDVKEILDTQHDTLLGAFVKGLRHALDTQEMWINASEVSPEKFEDFVVSDYETRPVLIKHKYNGEEVMALGSRLKVDGVWGWYILGSEHIPEVIEWKRA